MNYNDWLPLFIKQATPDGVFRSFLDKFELPFVSTAIKDGLIEKGNLDNRVIYHATKKGKDLFLK